ncbi:MAG: HD domain-containing phosphohydrolase [Rhodospirillales bacterium]
MPEKVTTTTPRILVLNDNIVHRDEVKKVLSRLYEVNLFDDDNVALDAMHANSPDIVVVDEHMLSDGSSHFLDEKRKSENLNSVPYIIIGKGGVAEKPDAIGGDGPAAYLKKPFTENNLLNQVASSMSHKVEDEWTSLPPVQRSTLQNTVKEFQGISEAIDKGEPLDIESAHESCEPLVESINNNQYQGILDSVKGHHNYTYVHSLRVATYLSIFGHAIGMRDDELLTLATGGLLHDVGKMVTPQGLLNKPSRLEDDEWKVMKGHVEHSKEILDRTPGVNRGIKIIAEQHHEKLDGTGYPLGLKDKQLNDLARMSAIVDIFGALTDVRSYKAAFPPEKAFAILEEMESGLDQSLVKKFRKVFEST